MLTKTVIGKINLMHMIARNFLASRVDSKNHYLLLGNWTGSYLNKLESPSPKGALCQVWLKLAKWFLRRRWKCKKFTNNDRQILITKIHLRLGWANNHCNLNIKSLRNTTVHTNKFEFSSFKDILRQVWLKLSQWYWWIYMLT